jgi:ribosomal protein S18 acetylase RimI-like enzyme
MGHARETSCRRAGKEVIRLTPIATSGRGHAEESGLMLDRLIHFFKGPNLFHPKVWKGRLRPITFRLLAPADIPRCLEIHALNEPGRFPDDSRPMYQTTLEAAPGITLVTECNHSVVATGRISSEGRRDVVVLSFGLVHPEHQGSGIGIALTLARLAMLSPDVPRYFVFIFAVEKSIGYYQRLGFRKVALWTDAQGNQHPIGYLLVSPRDILCCRRLLKDHGIQWPEDVAQIPVTEAKEPYWFEPFRLPPEDQAAPEKK